MSLVYRLGYVGIHVTFMQDGYFCMKIFSFKEQKPDASLEGILLDIWHKEKLSQSDCVGYLQILNGHCDDLDMVIQSECARYSKLFTILDSLK